MTLWYSLATTAGTDRIHRFGLDGCRTGVSATGTLALAGILALACEYAAEPALDSPSVEMAALRAGGSTASATRVSVRRAGQFFEVELTRDKPFRFTSAPPALVVGGEVFWRSRIPSDANNRALVFLLTPSEFDSLSDGSEVRLGYLGAGALSADVTGVSPAERSASADAAGARVRVRPERVDRQKRLGIFKKASLEVAP